MDATLVTGWEALGQRLGAALTRPTFLTFLHIATGWVLCRSKPTVTNRVCTIGSSLLGHVAKHWCSFPGKRQHFFRNKSSNCRAIFPHFESEGLRLGTLSPIAQP